jgi:hypothetical protein
MSQVQTNWAGIMGLPADIQSLFYFIRSVLFFCFLSVCKAFAGQRAIGQG